MTLPVRVILVVLGILELCDVSEQKKLFTLLYLYSSEKQGIGESEGYLE